MSKYYHIEIRAANTDTAVHEHECDIVEQRDTLAEAKQRIRYYLSPDYVRFNAPDPVTPIRFAQIWLTEVEALEPWCHSEYWAKGYNGEPKPVEAE